MNKIEKIKKEKDLLDKIGAEAYIEKKLDKKGYIIAAAVFFVLGFVAHAILF